MSGIVALTAAAAVTTTATVVAAASPDITAALQPFFEGGNEYAATTLGFLISIPGLALLTLIAGAARD
ncbi:MAG: hypothetical protein ABL907_20770 [Hyphomicrobium sp.]